MNKHFNGYFNQFLQNHTQKPTKQRDHNCIYDAEKSSDRQKDFALFFQFITLGESKN